jgi:Flp pilus assembly protein TadD
MTDRNQLCPCGSGRRYKHCHGALDAAKGASSATPESLTEADTLIRDALAAHQRGDLDRAERAYRKVLEAIPTHPLATHYLGVILYQHSRFAEALPLLERAVAAVPHEPEFHNNLGLALAASDRNDEAAIAYRQALALKPDHATAWTNLGLALQASNRLPDAIAAYREALARQPEFARAHWNLSLALLAHGEFAEGWREYEWRLEIEELGKYRHDFPSPRWDGIVRESFTLLVAAEQGLGDTLQFIRFAATLAARGIRVLVAVQPSLVALASTVPGVAAAVSLEAAAPPHDAHIPLLSLPHLLEVSPASIPAAVPYIAASPAYRARAAAELERRAGRLRVGLAWAGNKAVVHGFRRAIPLPQISPLFETPDVAWFSLQPIDDDAETAAADPHGALTLLPMRRDFDGTAALVAELDLIITIDTSIAHLAGALAKPVWILLPYAADWRWQLDRGDSPWYPTARLLRQPRLGDWKAIIRDVGTALRLRSGSKG